MNRPWLWLGVAAILLVVAGVAIASARPPLAGLATPAPASAAARTAMPGSPTSGPPTTGAPTPGAPTPGAEETLGQLLAMLRIAPEERAGYSRSLFVHWIDADGNGCNTRQEVLIRDAIVRPKVGAHCALSGGRWLSLYDGLAFTNPSKLQIDHVVPLAEAWDSGASAWTADRRMRFANDLGVPFALLAVSAATNESKSDADPADWLPPARAAECPYLGDWLATKARWDLTVDPREQSALAADIVACPSTQMPYLPAGPAGETGGVSLAPSPSGPGASSGACDPAYPTVCIPAPPPDLDCGDVPYRNFTVLPPDPHHFDGDHDGIGCET